MTNPVQESVRIAQVSQTSDAQISVHQQGLEQGLAQVSDRLNSNVALTSWCCLDAIQDFFEGMFASCCSFFRAIGEALGWIAPLVPPAPTFTEEEIARLDAFVKMWVDTYAKLPSMDEQQKNGTFDPKTTVFFSLFWNVYGDAESDSERSDRFWTELQQLPACV